jgi:hypothetical protein
LRTLSLALLFLVPGADPAPFLPRVGCPSAARLAMPAPPQVPGAGPLTVEDAITLAEEFDRITRRQVEVGSRPGIDQTQTSIEVSRARQQEDRIAATRSQVRQEVEQALARLRAADAVVRDDQGGVLDGARRLLEASRTGFQAGATSVIAILEAQRTYRSVLTDYTNALTAAGALLRRLARGPAPAAVRCAAKARLPRLRRRLAVARLSPARGGGRPADYPPEVSAAGGHPARAELERATGAVPADRLPDVSSQARRPQ